MNPNTQSVIKKNIALILTVFILVSCSPKWSKYDWVIWSGKSYCEWENVLGASIDSLGVIRPFYSLDSSKWDYKSCTIYSKKNVSKEKHYQFDYEKEELVLLDSSYSRYKNRKSTGTYFSSTRDTVFSWVSKHNRFGSVQYSLNSSGKLGNEVSRAIYDLNNKKRKWWSIKEGRIKMTVIEYFDDVFKLKKTVQLNDDGSVYKTINYDYSCTQRNCKYDTIYVKEQYDDKTFYSVSLIKKEYTTE